jgi:hypothetical protein
VIPRAVPAVCAVLAAHGLKCNSLHHHGVDAQDFSKVEEGWDGDPVLELHAYDAPDNIVTSVGRGQPWCGDRRQGVGEHTQDKLGFQLLEVLPSGEDSFPSVPLWTHAVSLLWSWSLLGAIVSLRSYPKQLNGVTGGWRSCQRSWRCQPRCQHWPTGAAGSSMHSLIGPSSPCSRRNLMPFL